MKKNLNQVLTGFFLGMFLIFPGLSEGQNEQDVIRKYLKKLPNVPVSGKIQKYRMTAVYTNRDLYGFFTGKTKVTGDYTRGLENGTVLWNNINIATSDKYSEPFPAGSKQEYMENFKYIPSSAMLNADAFKDFPAGVESVFSRNLVWDMMAIEDFALADPDSLELNRPYIIPQMNKEFKMADIGNYSHAEIQMIWTGISAFDNELCAVIDYRAIDNKVEITMEGLKTRGTEQYWGTILISLRSRMIEQANMYSGTIQEIEVTGMENKFLVKTIRELTVEKIN